MASTSLLGAGPPDDEIRMEKNAGLIMGTNNSSIVSKRSVERLYLPAPHFYRYFVRKPQRRSPTINRGYWLRMRAVDWAVRQFLEKVSDLKKLVINLGCGYDPLPFQWMARDKDLCNNTKFIDIDYEELMMSKYEVIKNTPEMKDMLTDLSDDNVEKSVLLNSLEYAAIGCDLRNLPRLKRLVQSIVDTQQCAVLCVAEVSITYMHTQAANEVITWTSSLSPDVTFCLLEQASPDRPDHPFTTTMMKHFNKLGTPLHSVFEYPDKHTQTLRFQQAGFTHCDTQNLWELWSDPRFLSPSQRLALDNIEPFDEWEEFALFASHYLLVTAHNRFEPIERNGRSSRRDSVASMASDISARTASPWRPDSQWFAMKYCDDKSEDTRRHHGSAYQLPEEDAIAVHGGIGPKARLATTAVCKSTQAQKITSTVINPETGARCCHTITTLANGTNILIGGRGSPNQPMRDCWLQVNNEWVRIHDLPEPRYRHRTVSVMLPDNTYGAVVFGGKTGPSRVATDVILWDPRKGWSVLQSLKQDPMPRFGASFVHLGFNHGLLFGGMRQDGVICQGLWRWRLVIRENKVAGIWFKPSKALDATVGSYPWFSRLGASWDLARDELLIIGGVAKSGCIPKSYEIMSLLGSFSAFLDHEREMRLRLTCVAPVMSPECPRPLLVGHSTHRTATGMLIFLGGGATCFSFGNYYNSGLWVLHEKEAGLHTDWTVVQALPSESKSRIENKKTNTESHPTSTEKVDMLKSVTTDAFIRVVHSSQPAVLKSLELGPCLKTWTPDYLGSKIGADRSVVVHASPSSSMNFQRKNFAYQTLKFDKFIEVLTSPTNHIYLRALSAASPTTSAADFDSDWPEIAPDVQIPPQLSSVLMQTKHSSCLRISNKTTMWLHYDVMANVLFQIHGIKKLILFPPTDLKYLSFPPGSTTSEVDVFSLTNTATPPELNKSEPQKEQDHTINIPSNTSPRIVILYPGDALFIPPLWAHTGTSLIHNTQQHPLSNETNTTPSSTTATSAPAPASTNPQSQPHSQNPFTNISLNIFFRSLPPKLYAHGRDIYGNRDLSAYEDGRRDIDRIVRRFTSISSTTITSTSNETQTKRTAQTQEEANDKSGQENGDVNVNDHKSRINEHDQEKDKDKYINGITQTIPKDVTKAYLERLVDELKKKIDEL